MLPATKTTPFRIKYARQATGAVLDCASGTGSYRQYFNSQKIFSLDLTLSQLKSVPGPKVCADASLLPFKDNAFDSVWFCGALQYLRGDLKAIISGFIRVTKPRGKILILTPNKLSLIDKIKTVLGLRGWASQGPVIKLYTAQELKNFGSVCGEVRFFPFLDFLFRKFPGLGHTLLLEINVSDSKEITPK